MSAIPACPQCGLENTYPDGALTVCADCGHEWAAGDAGGGSGAGIVVAWWVDEKKLHFPIDGVWWAQVLKIVIGMALIMGVRLGMKPVLAAIFGDQAFTSAIRYFLMVMVGGILWPMTFRFWAKVGQKQK